MKSDGPRTMGQVKPPTGVSEANHGTEGLQRALEGVG